MSTQATPLPPDKPPRSLRLKSPEFVSQAGLGQELDRARSLVTVGSGALVVGRLTPSSPAFFVLAISITSPRPPPKSLS
jgi:hypothetical protein